MSDISELERRIVAALERIDSGLEVLRQMPAEAAPQPVQDEGEVSRLAEALEAERIANAQLTERVRAIKERQETAVSALEKKVERLTQRVGVADAEMQRLREINEELSAANRDLTAAAAAGIPDPGLINRAMQTELAALRAQRAAEMAEMDGILAELKPLIGEVA